MVILAKENWAELCAVVVYVNCPLYHEFLEGRGQVRKAAQFLGVCLGSRILLSRGHNSNSSMKTWWKAGRGTVSPGCQARAELSRGEGCGENSGR